MVNCQTTVLGTSFSKYIVFFLCMGLYSEEVNVQNFVMIQCKIIICHNYLCTKSFILLCSLDKKLKFPFFPIAKWLQSMQKSIK